MLQLSRNNLIFVPSFVYEVVLSLTAMLSKVNRRKNLPAKGCKMTLKIQTNRTIKYVLSKL